jgi:hypothetical protein
MTTAIPTPEKLAPFRAVALNVEVNSSGIHIHQQLFSIAIIFFLRFPQHPASYLLVW